MPRAGVVGRGELAQLVRDLGKLSPELRRQLRPKLRKAAEGVRDEARRGASWSTRIPPATRVRTSLSGGRTGVAVVVNAKKAPHARPYENGGKEGEFRHPVFGNRKVWVYQRARPFLFPAARAHRDDARRRVAEAVDEAARAHGWR